MLVRNFKSFHAALQVQKLLLLFAAILTMIITMTIF
jgi:hypothetical protein